MKQPEDLIWQSRAGKRLRYFMLLGIRFVEICMASVIPSIIGLMLVFYNSYTRIMSIMSFLSFIAFAVCNWIFWMRYAKQRTKRTEFFVINGIAYILYAGISCLIYKFTGPLLYSVVFSNLRAFEAFGLPTSYSLILSHCVVIALMIICQLYSKRYYTQLLEKLAENGADEIEMDPWGKLVPMQKNKKVDMLSVEEIHKQMEEDSQEAAQILQEETAQTLWDENMVKGKGAKIEQVEIENIDADLSDGDFIAGVGTERDIDNYDTDALWNKEIYQGRKVAENYDDEPEDMPDFFAVNHYEGEENELLWSKEMHQGNKKVLEFVEDYGEEDDKPNYSAYEGDGLWDNSMHQGRGKAVTRPDPVEEAKREFVEIPTENSGYSADKLWDDGLCQGNGKEVKAKAFDEWTEEGTNAMNNYDADNLWDSVKQGKR